MVSFKGHSDATELPIQHEGFLTHKRYRYLKVAGFLSVVSIVAYFIADAEPRPNGGTWLGYTLGTISALLIFWLALLGRPETRHHSRPLEFKGVDLGACLSWLVPC